MIPFAVKCSRFLPDQLNHRIHSRQFAIRTPQLSTQRFAIALKSQLAERAFALVSELA